MKAENLLRPRFEVISDFPNNEDEIGTIFTCSIHWRNYYRDYPHIFRELNWWEYRREENMPKRVKCKDGSIYEIEKWDMDNLCGHVTNYPHYCVYLTKDVLPID